MFLLFLAAAAAQPSAAEKAAIFRAAGFIPRDGEWRTKDCEGMEGASYTPGTVEEFRDVNGDDRPEAVVTESSAICYGMAGTHFWLLSQQADGAWKVMFHETGMPEFLATRGSDNWPDVSVGGPGFCFPVVRWNGTAYERQRFEYDGRACEPPAT